MKIRNIRFIPSRSDADGIGKSLPPGGHPRVASLALRAIHLQVAPKGSEEECGRKTDGQYNLSDLLKG